MAVRQRPVQADYLKIGEDWELMKLSFTKLNEKPNAKTKEKRYVDQSNSTSTIVGYGWTQPFEADQIIGDRVIEYIRDIAELCKTGAETETEKLIVDMDKPSNEEGGYRARKFNVAIKVDELTDNDGEMGMTGEFVGQGNPVLGTFNKETKTFTEGFTAREEVTIGTLTVVSTAGTAIGTTKVTVTPALVGSGNSYKYKLGTNAVTISLGQDCTLLDTWNGTDDITATAGQTITIVEVDKDNKAVKVGSATVTVA